MRQYKGRCQVLDTRLTGSKDFVLFLQLEHRGLVQGLQKLNLIPLFLQSAVTPKDYLFVVPISGVMSEIV